MLLRFKCKTLCRKCHNELCLTFGSIISPLKRLLFFGYFGHGNFGDDLLLWTACLRLGRLVEKGELEIAVTADTEYETLPIPVEYVPRKNLRALSAAIRGADAVCAPGGGLFQDKTSLKSVLYYANIVRTARKCGKKVALIGQGIGPLISPVGKLAVNRSFSGADFLSVRDAESKTLLQSLNVKGEIEQTADFTFALQRALMPGEVRSRTNGGSNTIRILVCPKPHGQFETQISNIATALHGTRRQFEGQSVELKVAALHREQDTDVANAIASAVGCDFLEFGTGNPITHMPHFGWADVVLSYRLHGCILAAQFSKPFVAISYDPKVSALARAFGQVDLAPGVLEPRQKSDALVASYRRGFDEGAAAELKRMKDLADKDVEALFELVKG